ncbi:hypothetical protein G6F45_013712 [Rhizopus arrhizus]|nr:hypothetical protein G6F45_013712 [Rhizopus arrhizus]
MTADEFDAWMKANGIRQGSAQGQEEKEVTPAGADLGRHAVHAPVGADPGQHALKPRWVPTLVGTPFPLQQPETRPINFISNSTHRASSMSGLSP